MDDNRQTERRREKDTRTILALSAERKMIDGHIREIEGDVFEYLPEIYHKCRQAASLTFRCCHTTAGTSSG